MSWVGIATSAQTTMMTNRDINVIFRPTFCTLTAQSRINGASNRADTIPFKYGSPNNSEMFMDTPIKVKFAVDLKLENTQISLQ